MFGKEELIERFDKLDEILADEIPYDITIELVVVGGSALILCDLVSTSRRTVDIDLLRCEEKTKKYFDFLDMNDDANTFLYRMPDGWEGRKVVIEGDWERLRLFAPSPEDLAIMKLISNREKDFQDVEAMVEKRTLNLVETEKLLKNPLEVQLNLDDETWLELKRRFEKIKTETERGREDEKAETGKMAPKGAEAHGRAREIQRKDISRGRYAR